MEELINREGASLVDVRSKLEYMLGHVAGSVNIPMDQVPERMEELRSMSKPLILFCQSGNRSGQVLNYLQSEGFEDTHNGGGWAEVKRMLKK